VSPFARLLAPLATVVLTAGLLSATTAPAEAAGWRTVATYKGAKAQACRDHYGDDGSFYLMMRHDGRRAWRTARSVMRVPYGAGIVDVTRTRWVRPGRRTEPKVTGAYTRRATYRVRMTVRLRNGTKRTNVVRMRRIPRCPASVG